MSCSACSNRVEKAVQKLDGMDQVTVNLLTNSMQVSYDDKKVSSSDIVNAVTDAGYGASLDGGGNTSSAPAKKSPWPI